MAGHGRRLILKTESVKNWTCPVFCFRFLFLSRFLFRELRDRCLERFNDGLLIAPSGKYDVSRSLPAMSAVESAAPDAPRALPNAA